MCLPKTKNRPPPRRAARVFPQGTTLALAGTPSAAFPRGLLRGLWMMLLPLPLGEGWGEGRRRVMNCETIENETGLQRLWGKREQLVY